MKQATSTSKVKQEKAVGRPAPAAKKEDIKGLCVTCNTDDVCKKTRAHARPVNHCEEFDTRGPEPEVGYVFPETEPSMQAVSGEYSGICTNCDNRTTCLSSNTEGGIWHCEEYL